MVNRLPAWVFIAFALGLIGLALLPIMRVVFAIDESIQVPFSSVVILLIGGVMCGLTGMLLLAKRQPELNYSATEVLSHKDRRAAAIMHASGLLIFTGLPLINFLLCYFFWVRNRHKSATLDQHGREAICQQITFYLYALMCLFMALVFVGVIGLLFLLIIQAAFSIIATIKALGGELFRYPANIAVIDRKLPIAVRQSPL